MEKKQRLPKDISNFITLRKGNFLFVDKTQFVYDLYCSGEGERYYFLSRPRRFGKSLWIALLKEFFLGNRDLFKGLWIDNTDYDWPYHPVIHLDFALINSRTDEEFFTDLSLMIDHIAKKYKIDVTHLPYPHTKLRILIEELSNKHGHNSVVVLVDEYDKPLLDNLADETAAAKIRDILKSFYGIFKGLDLYLRAIFITGVTKFAKTSIFSGINNLDDISFDPRAASLLGYTEEELRQYFLPYINEMADKKHKSQDEILSELRRWYNGYRFSEKDVSVYNPFSITYVLKKQKITNYWFESGTTSFLVNLLRKDFVDLDEVSDEELDVKGLGTFDVGNIPLVPILYQSGYLTITAYDDVTELSRLGYPNKEVRKSFERELMQAITKKDYYSYNRALSKMRKALEGKDIEGFCQTMHLLFAHIPYQLHVTQERYYHSILQLLGTLLGLDAQSEISTDKGNIDLVIETKKYIYLFELKYNTDPKKAMEQIEDRRYYERFMLQDKEVILVGLSFNRKDSTLDLACSSKELTQ